MLSFVLCHDDERMNLGSYEAGHKNYLGLGWGGFTPNLTPSCSSLHHSLHTLHHTLLLTLQLSPLIHNYTIAIIATYTDTQHNILSSSQVFQPLNLNPWFFVVCCITSHISLQPSHHTSHITPGCLLWWQSRNCEIVKTGSVATLCPAFKPYPLLGCKVLKSNVQWLFRLFYDNI